jgi:nicotinamidase-related amidase
MSDPSRHLGLLLVDLQDCFLQAIPDRESILARTSFVLKAARLLDIPVVVTEQLPEKLGPTTESLRQAWAPNTPVFAKSGFSAFAAEGLDRWIESNQIDHLLLAGIESSICIYQTAVQALSDDLGVTLLADCIGQRRPQDREPVLRQLLAMDAHVLPSETIFYSLLGSAEHPAFREFTALVKAGA